MNKIKIVTFLFLLGVFLFPFSMAFAHPGRTDASGCHTCRTNCSKWGLGTGEYHCHNAKALPQPEEPVKSHYSETGGYTEPAPEYKKTETTLQFKEEIVNEDPPIKSQEKSVNKKNDSWIVRLFKLLFS